MKFPYLKTPTRDPNKKWVSRPLVPITLFGTKGSISLDALIDSGADQCLFHNEIGEAIGLDLEKGEKKLFGGIEGGNILVHLHKVQLQIVGMDKRVTIVAGFADTPGISAILGQEDFFDKFRIKFERDHGIIEVTPAPKN